MGLQGGGELGEVGGGDCERHGGYSYGCYLMKMGERFEEGVRRREFMIFWWGRGRMDMVTNLNFSDLGCLFQRDKNYKRWQTTILTNVFLSPVYAEDILCSWGKQQKTSLRYILFFLP